MRLLKATTIEEQIGEIDAYLDDLIRKPRKVFNNTITAIPGGCVMEPVVSGAEIFVGFFTVDGDLSSLVTQLPVDAKTCTLAIQSICDNITTSVTFQIGKGQTSIAGPVSIKANTKVSISITTENPIPSALVGYIFTPKGA